MHSRSAAVLLATALLAGTAGIAGCSSGSPASGAAQSSATSADASAAQSPAPAGEGFGQTLSWDGLDVTVTTPVAFAPSKLASFPEGSRRFVSVGISVRNTSREPLQTMFLTTSATSGGRDAGRVADSDNRIGAPVTAIAPGESLTWNEAFPMPGEDLALTVGWAPPKGEPASATLTLSGYPAPATPSASATG